MSNVTIDFDTLKFNLYEILGIDSDSDDKKIKKAFRNLILNFYPDKNKEAEEDIYYHILTANQVLSNKEHRKRYDDYLNKLQDTHDELKNKFKKDLLTNPENKDDAFKIFQEKFKELDKRHYEHTNKFDIDLNNIDKIINERNKEINIPSENIKSTNDFNNKFEERIMNGKFNDQIIPVEENMKLSSYNVNDNYTSLDIAFDNLYVDGGGISTSKYTSLDSAFKLQPVNTRIVKNTNIKEEINRYNSMTNNLSSIEYSKDRFDLW
jgi:curved DNA-binding protein CbpA